SRAQGLYWLPQSQEPENRVPGLQAYLDGPAVLRIDAAVHHVSPGRGIQAFSVDRDFWLTRSNVGAGVQQDLVVEKANVPVPDPSHHWRGPDWDQVDGEVDRNSSQLRRLSHLGHPSHLVAGLQLRNPVQQGGDLFDVPPIAGIDLLPVHGA